jgi:hypothetical protein
MKRSKVSFNLALWLEVTVLTIDLSPFSKKRCRGERTLRRTGVDMHWRLEPAPIVWIVQHIRLSDRMVPHVRQHHIVDKVLDQNILRDRDGSTTRTKSGDSIGDASVAPNLLSHDVGHCFESLSRRSASRVWFLSGR